MGKLRKAVIVCLLCAFLCTACSSDDTVEETTENIQGNDKVIADVTDVTGTPEDDVVVITNVPEDDAVVITNAPEDDVIDITNTPENVVTDITDTPENGVGNTNTDTSVGTNNTDPAITDSTTGDATDHTWSPDSLRAGITTSIEYDKKYDAIVGSAEDALRVVKMYGDMQKATYDNPAISAIETQMENEFGMVYVALGEIDEATAKDIYAGFRYMFEKYPELQGTLTDFTLGNFSWNAMAETRTFEFMANAGRVPMVLKREIIINAAQFLNRDDLLSDCEYNEETGYWPKNSSITMVIVHELGHHLLDVHNTTLYGFSGYYVNEENFDSYIGYVQENLSWNQEEIKRIMAVAYAEWSKTNEGSEEDFRASISTYAKGIQHDGGISYAETFAEAVADIYANGDEAAEASKLILAAFEQ